MANYFQGAKGFTINGGTFGQDYSRHTNYHGPVHRTNDYSKHTTNFGGYVNHGQHAANGGTINNLGPQTTNHGPIYGYRQYAESRGGSRRSPRPPSPPDMDDGYDVPLSRSGQQNRRRYPPQDTDPIYGRDDDRNLNVDDYDDGESSDEDEPNVPPPRRRAQQPTVPPRRPQAERSGNLDDSLSDELKNLSPDMQLYVKTLMQQSGRRMPPVQPENDLQDRMASMQLHDAEPLRRPTSRSSARTQNPPRKPPARRTRLPPARVSDENSTEDEDEPDGNYGSTTITSTDSHNVNSTTVVDSHNDNSTKTEISKAYGAR